MMRLPGDHKAKWFSGAALNSSEQGMASVLSTVLSRLNTFLDSELEQILCFDTAIDAERFCNEKSALFVVMPEENPGMFFMVSLIIQQLYREILCVADEKGGKLDKKAMFYCDEFGTLPPIESAEMMFSAARSRKLSIVAVIQSYQQLEKNYGREGAAIICDNAQLTIAGGFAPGSESAERISKALGERTVLSGTVTKGKDSASSQMQMTGRALLSPDELKSMKKGSFIVLKTGAHPFISKLKLFFEWGISFDEANPYSLADQGGWQTPSPCLFSSPPNSAAESSNLW
jgi:type IV secretion system protein VirD4